MNEHTIHADAAATISRLQKKHPNLKQELAESWGFAVFPYVGRASAVLGGAYGHGEVFEQGRSIGFATLSQMTVGVQLGGQTFSELVIFPKKEVLDEFRTGMVAFTANASAVIVKAAASGTTNFDGVTAHAYSRGGMLLELSLGGQKFMFIPPAKPPLSELEAEGSSKEGEEPRASGDAREAEAREARASGDSGDEESEERQASSEEGGDGSGQRASEDEGASEEDDPSPGEDALKSLRQLGSTTAAKKLRKLGSKVVGKLREAGGHLPIPALQKEAEADKRLHADVVATLERMKAKDPSLKKQLEKAYGYAVYPTVGRASLVLGCSYGKGEVFKQGKQVGFAGLMQITVGVQVGGQTYSQLVLFQDEAAFKRFKEGKVGFAANLSAVIVKAGAAATNNYKQGMQVYVHSEGGMAIEAVIGGQKLIYRPAGMMRGKPADRDPALELGRTRPAVEPRGGAAKGEKGEGERRRPRHAEEPAHV
ncbi:MAG TPA: hypothetical protein VN033_02550 [Vulgatibacter sp.]|nr:hypothetical protein [Vulgatibacter sp.]